MLAIKLDSKSLVTLMIISCKGITMGVRHVHFPLCALERLVINFPRVNLDFFIFMYFHTKSSYFHIADSSRIRFHFLTPDITVFLSWSLTTFVYSPSRNSSSFSRVRPRELELGQSRRRGGLVLGNEKEF